MIIRSIIEASAVPAFSFGIKLYIIYVQATTDIFSKLKLNNLVLILILAAQMVKYVSEL